MTSDATFLAKWLRSVRIDAEVLTVPMARAVGYPNEQAHEDADGDNLGGNLGAKWPHGAATDSRAPLEALAAALREESRVSSLVIVPLPLGALHADSGSSGLLQQLSASMPPIVFAFEGSGMPVTTTDI